MMRGERWVFGDEVKADSTVWKKLVRLENSGILTSEHRGNSKVYQV
jgi:hypothetical protein